MADLSPAEQLKLPIAKRLLEYKAVLQALMTNKHIDLGDLVYTVRDKELQGWDGPSVKAWSEAVGEAKRLLKEDGLDV